jgi:hypothetical protein
VQEHLVSGMPVLSTDREGSKSLEIPTTRPNGPLGKRPTSRSASSPQTRDDAAESGDNLCNPNGSQSAPAGSGTRCSRPPTSKVGLSHQSTTEFPSSSIGFPRDVEHSARAATPTAASSGWIPRDATQRLRASKRRTFSIHSAYSRGFIEPTPSSAIPFCQAAFLVLLLVLP